MGSQNPDQHVAETLGISISRARVLLLSNNHDVDVAIRSYRGMSASHVPFEPTGAPKTHKSTVPHQLPCGAEDVSKNLNLGSIPPPPSETSSHDQDDSVWHVEWDFILPRVPIPESLTSQDQYGSGRLFLDELVGIIQHGEGYKRIQNYLASYSPETVRAQINGDVLGFPAFFYVVEARNAHLVRLWAKYGGDVNATVSSGSFKGVPLLAYAVALGGSFRDDTTELVATLLSIGADAAVLPQAFYLPLTRDLAPEGPPIEEMPELTRDDMSWCTLSVRALLACRISYGERYYMHKARMLKPHGPRAKQVTRYKDADNLLGVPYFLVGQAPAIQFVINRLLRHLAKPSRSPLVMLFAGPSGHGKTELARRLGELISLDMEIVDCANKSDEKEMFGARAPYQGWENSSPLNSFLARNGGKRCIVFLDEFEKTTSNVHQTLLIPFQKGEYEDRKTRATVDCSKAIWILATNAFDDTIHEFCKANQTAHLQSGERTATSQKLLRSLFKTLRTKSISRFGAPLTGRITEFVPFLTFSAAEQAAVAHKYLTEVGKELAKPTIVTHAEETQRFVGDIDLQVPQDYSVCRVIAQEEYDEQLGARSVINGVSRMIEGEVIEHYLETKDEIREGQDMTIYLVQPTLDGDIEVCHVGKNRPGPGGAEHKTTGSVVSDMDSE